MELLELLFEFVVDVVVEVVVVEVVERDEMAVMGSESPGTKTTRHTIDSS